MRRVNIKAQRLPFPLGPRPGDDDYLPIRPRPMRAQGPEAYDRWLAAEWNRWQTQHNKEPSIDLGIGKERHYSRSARVRRLNRYPLNQVIPEITYEPIRMTLTSHTAFGEVHRNIERSFLRKDDGTYAESDRDIGLARYTMPQSYHRRKRARPGHEYVIGEDGQPHNLDLYHLHEEDFMTLPPLPHDDMHEL